MVQMYVGQPGVGIPSGIGDPDDADFLVVGPAVGSNFGSSMSNAGDVLDDGTSDLWAVSPSKAKLYLANLVAGTRVYETPFEQEMLDIGPNYMGSSIVGNVDLDGDGFMDLVLGSKGSDMFVMYGTASGVTKTGQQTLSRPGANVHYGGPNAVGTHIAVGDYDDDGILDIFACIGSPSADDSFAAGVISYGKPSRAGWTSVVLADASILGGCVQPHTARFDDDDIDDLIVGAGIVDTVNIFSGASNRVHPHQTVERPTGSGNFGHNVALIDLDHDGRDDFVVCDPSDASATGICFVYNSLNLTTPVMTLTGTSTSEEFGTPAVAVDLNCDGFDDLAVTSRDGGFVSVFLRIPPPTVSPTLSPTVSPTVSPTPAPTRPPTLAPTLYPTQATSPGTSTSSPGSTPGGTESSEEDGSGEGEASFVAANSGALIGVGAAVVASCVLCGVFYMVRVRQPSKERRNEGGGASQKRHKATGMKQVETAPESEGDGVVQHLMTNYEDITLGDVLGEGSFGTVYRGQWNGIDVAVKTSRQSLQAQRAMMSEVKEVQSLRAHPNLVQILGVVSKPELMIVTEYMSKGSLVDLLYDEVTKKSVGTLQKARKVSIARDIAAGMRHLHAHNVVHRDLAARNVLLDQSFRAKVADFGMARSLASGSAGSTAVTVGPLKWMAPEQFSGGKRLHYSTKSDVWSFGITLFEVFGETEPWLEVTDVAALQLKIGGGASPEVPAESPPVVVRVMEMCFTPSPDDRASMSEVHGILQRGAKESESVDGVRTYSDAGKEAAAAARSAESAPRSGKMYDVPTGTGDAYGEPPETVTYSEPELGRSRSKRSSSRRKGGKAHG
jgi:serine/threonine protein kinase